MVGGSEFRNSRSTFLSLLLLLLIEEATSYPLLKKIEILIILYFYFFFLKSTNKKQKKILEILFFKIFKKSTFSYTRRTNKCILYISFLEEEQEQLKRVFPHYYIFCWNTTGIHAHEFDMHIHKQIEDAATILARKQLGTLDNIDEKKRD